jgi:hypothetical protein
MLLAGLRRLALLVLGAAGATAVGSIVIGLVVGSSLGRALTIGYYLAGSFLLLAGFFVGNRGPARVKSESAAPGGIIPFVGGGRHLRWATLGEQEESINMSAVFVVLGLILVAIGVCVDSRHELF